MFAAVTKEKLPYKEEENNLNSCYIKQKKIIYISFWKDTSGTICQKLFPNEIHLMIEESSLVITQSRLVLSEISVANWQV